MAVSGYPNMENIPPAQNYTAPPRVAVPPLYHHPQQHHRSQQPDQQLSAYSSLSPNYPPPTSPNLSAVYPQARSNNRAAPLSPVPPASSWSNGTNGAATVGIRPMTSSSPAGGRSSGPNAALFRPLVLEQGTWYSVFISSNEGGPADFSVQLASWGKKLEQLMADINSCELRPLGPGAVQAGAACLARYTVDSTIYRAVILQRAESVKVFDNYLPVVSL